jgi:hypothetical protein
MAASCGSPADPIAVAYSTSVHQNSEGESMRELGLPYGQAPCAEALQSATEKVKSRNVMTQKKGLRRMRSLRSSILARYRSKLKVNLEKLFQSLLGDF